MKTFFFYRYEGNIVEKNVVALLTTPILFVSNWQNISGEAELKAITQYVAEPCVHTGDLPRTHWKVAAISCSSL